MKMLAQLQNRFDQWIEQVNQYLDRLTVRERIMVVFTTIFVVVAIIGASLWKMHSLAEQQQQRLNDLKDLMVWMQSNAVTMKPASELELGQAEKNTTCSSTARFNGYFSAKWRAVTIYCYSSELRNFS